MFSSNCCFLTCIQVSQEAGQVIWYSHLFRNFPQFIVIHTVKGFGIVNKAEIDVFLELSCFFDDPVDVGNLISGSSAFSSLNVWKFTYCWSLAWRILSMTLLACEMSAILRYFEHSLALPFWRSQSRKAYSNRRSLSFSFSQEISCSHEIKRCLLLGRKVMTNVDSIFKSRDITLPKRSI